jgi:DNA-binding GntR family transcriptional regulator
VHNVDAPVTTLDLPVGAPTHRGGLTAMAPRRPPPKTGPLAEARMYQAIVDALSDGALPPGTRLVEEQVAAAFAVSRERARKVLDRLVHERRLVRVVNRGVSVPKPTTAEAREVYRARRILEAGIVRGLADPHNKAIIARLRQHIRREKAAHAGGQHAAAARLSGEFHFLLADGIGNADISRFVRELVSRTRLFMAALPAATECSADEHAAIVDALERGDSARAVELADAHLRAVEERLARGVDADVPVDLRAVLSGRR